MRLRASMKFLLEFVACCGASTFRQQAPAEERRWLVSPPESHHRIRRRKKARVVVTRRGRPVEEWRPSLTSISEDAAPAPEKIEGVSIANRKIRKVASAASTPRPSQYRDETGRSATMIVPALSPALPFMF